MTKASESNAVVWCEGAFNTPNGKTAHGLVRRGSRYRIIAVIDSNHAGGDAGDILDGRSKGIPVVADLAGAREAAQAAGEKLTHFVVGLAPDGGRLPAAGRAAIREAIEAGLDVDSGLHDFISDDEELAGLASANGVTLRDVRKTPGREALHAFSGEIENVESFRVALLGTDSAVGKRTTAWLLVDGLEAAGYDTELIGTGQTAWLQGAEYSIILDSLINDFVAGELEHAIVRAWKEKQPQAMVIEGQGSLMNPAYPGGYEILAAGRPDVVVLQHAPARREYDGFPGYPIEPLKTQIRAIELISSKPVVAITINHEKMTPAEVTEACRRIKENTGRPAFDVLADGPGELVDLLTEYLEPD
ncbi:MAG: DUF1611 domain-containing protein [Acidobacteriota bacterium]|jgi:uncharacterized NAD-dependent epimerase/dehydratase family protein